MSDGPNTQNNVRELTPAELDQIAGGDNIGVGIGEIDLSTFGTYQPVNVGVGVGRIGRIDVHL